MIKAIIFDLGGTLVFPKYKNTFEFIHAAAKKAEIPDSEISFNHLINIANKYKILYTHSQITSLSDYLTTLFMLIDEYCHSISKINKYKFIHHIIHEEVYLDLDIHEKNLLNILKSYGVKLILLSNWPIIYPFVHEKLSLFTYFDDFYISSFLKKEKPSSELFNIILDNNNIYANEVIMVGNSFKFDILPAMNVGMHTIIHQKEKDSISDLRRKIYSIMEV